MRNVEEIIQLVIFTPLLLGGIGDIAEYFVNGFLRIFEIFVEGTIELTLDVFNAIIWLIVGTPSPADGISPGELFGEPSRGTWTPFYEFFIESTQPISILLLVAQVAIVIVFASGPFLFSNYDKERYFRRIFQAFVGVTAWWFLFTFSTQFANELAMYIGGLHGPTGDSVNFAEFIEFGLQALLTSTVLIIIAALASMASTALILFVAAMYISRMVVIFAYSFSMPIFMALWPANIGFLKPVSELMKKFMELYIPILFLTLPNALILRTAQLLGEAAITPDEIETGGGDVGIGEIFSIAGGALTSLVEGILFLVLALVLPIIAIIAPKFVFQATGGSFGRVARTLERSRALSTTGNVSRGGGQQGGFSGGQQGGFGGEQRQQGGGLGGEMETEMPSSRGRGGTTGSETSRGATFGAGDVSEEQADYEFSLGRSTFSTENTRKRAEMASRGVDKVRGKVDDIKGRFTSDEQRSTFQSIEARKKAYENEDGERVPVETRDPETIADMDDQYVAPQTAQDRYSGEELAEMDRVADTGDQYESPEPYYTPEEPETGEGGMDVDPETDPEYVGYERTRQYSKANYDAYNARKDSDINPDDVTSPYSDSSDGVVSGGGFSYGDVETPTASGSTSDRSGSETDPFAGFENTNEEDDGRGGNDIESLMSEDFGGRATGKRTDGDGKQSE